MRRVMMAAVGLLLMVSARPALSQGELGIYGGGAKLGDYGTLDPRNRPLYGGRLGYFFTPALGLEFSGQRLATHAKAVETQDITLTSFRGNLLLNLPAGRIQPFITAGAGAERTHVEALGSKTNFGWNAGGGLRLMMTNNLDLRADGRYVRVNAKDFGGHQNNGEATLGLDFLFGGRPGVARIASAPAAPSVSCAADQTTVPPGSAVTLHATATDPKNNTLTYHWTTTAGTVTGTGPDARLDLSGVAAPATATVTVQVTDRHGQTASSDCVVALAEATPPPAPAQAQAVSCLASGFPRNLSRLTNVDKACLDDVVQRLNADPRARVEVIGYADSHERNPDQLSRQRADAIQGYLTQAGVDASRITVQSMGAGQPLETGTDLTSQARNRRVQVWFVPEGATIPQ